jgi:hypothetical protein
VPGSEPLAFIGSQTFGQFHHKHHDVFGMVRYAGGEVQVVRAQPGPGPPSSNGALSI